ncbi:hypothetical protein AB6A40_004026 [Gnathostoma spinigerum]|uniref:Uncharacterized protein n=1 Tax=Gnathostoma spinigerum TaxID=75299 RepID=A0ABD6EL66_9BILA
MFSAEEFCILKHMDSVLKYLVSDNYCESRILTPSISIRDVSLRRNSDKTTKDQPSENFQKVDTAEKFSRTCRFVAYVLHKKFTVQL